MANAAFSRNRRCYVTAVTTFGTAVAPTNSDAMRYIDLSFTPSQSESVRPDINPALDITVGNLGRKQCGFTLSCSLAGGSGAGVAPDIGKLLKAMFGKALTIVGGTSVTAATDDNVYYVDIWQYISPSTAVQEGLLSCTVNSMEIEFGGDYAIIKFSGEGKSYVDSNSLTSLDTEGKGGLSAWPTEPASPVVNGLAVSGYRGTLTIDGNVMTNAKSGKITFSYAKALQQDGWGSDYPQAAAPDIRQVTWDLSMYDDDSAALNTIKGKATLGTTIDASFALGSVAGGIFTISLNDILLSKPAYDNSSTKRVVNFNGNKAHATSGTSKDALQIAIT